MLSYVYILCVESHTSKRCLDVPNMCMKDKSCNQLMADMEKKCNNIHTWNEYSMNNPTCSNSYFSSDYISTGSKEKCGVHVTVVCLRNMMHTFLSKNNAFEEH